MNILESLENLPISETCFDEILSLIEEYINELDDGTYRRTRDIAKAIADEQEKVLPFIKNEEEKERIKKEIVKRRRQAAKADDKYESRIVRRAEKEYKESKKKEN